ncbi:type 11 methyltransferase [Youhaiella tibetensis]|uniref:Class I SAM-dependent methyltransferase n=1 Tax=Paradevosia tibetensis TaxID=1447062 RepID=A0A5B9DJT1_9HYPH|nr:class I SAM-dependent methyltransferase [Youhaiella tibetensis]QEE19490.1 class I SAM-dependent methyltransferase [Youhaiella tibetensis]GGF32673.1 type 11 methyltransferase [Youhaiella tibetensis]
MAQDQNEVVFNYGDDAIIERIDAALTRAGHDPAHVKPDDLYPFDQLHGRQLAATREHVARLAPDLHMHVLDIGSGVGGPARYIATAIGARVTGIDLTPQFVATARELTRRCGLERRVEFVEGNAAHMPFAPETFDAAICLYVGMNIPDKPAVLAEAFRVLKPGARLLWSQVVAGQGTPHYPLPWARNAQASHAGPPDELRAALTGAGFEILEWVDETAALLPAGGAAPPPGADPSVNQLVMGADFVERRKDFMASLAEGALRSVVVLARKAGP